MSCGAVEILERQRRGRRDPLFAVPWRAGVGLRRNDVRLPVRRRHPREKEQETQEEISHVVTCVSRAPLLSTERRNGVPFGLMSLIPVPAPNVKVPSAFHCSATTPVAGRLPPWMNFHVPSLSIMSALT